MAAKLDSGAMYFIKRKSIIVFLLYALVFMCVLLPTGSIYKINVKIITTAFLVFVIFFDLFQRNCFDMRVVLISIYSAVFILLSWFIAVFRDVELSSSLTHLVAIISVLLIVFSVQYSIKNKYLNNKSYLIFVVIVFSIYSFGKVLVAVLFLLNIVNSIELLMVIENVFGYQGISLSNNVATRINFPIDFLAPGIIFFTINLKSFDVKISKTIKFSILVFAFLSVIVSYSRYLWAISAVSFLISLLCTLHKGKILITKKFLINSVGALAFFVTISFIGFDTVIQFVENRYTGNYADESDSFRVLMSNALYPMFYSNPFFGNGLGAYSSELIRFDDIRWNYELEWLASLMQFGLFGMLNVLVVFVAVIVQINKKIRLVSLGITCLLILFLSVGFFNCFLLTSSSGVIFSQIMIMASRYAEISDTRASGKNIPNI